MSQVGGQRRARLNRQRVLQAAVSLADGAGIVELSMRRLAQELHVVPMALYKHVANKEELLDGMVEVVVSEIDQAAGDTDWKTAVRLRVLSARAVLQRHQWARQVLESRTNQTPAVLEYMDSFIAMFLAGGLTVDLTHHVMHAMGSRIWGFTQELFEERVRGGEAGDLSPEAQAAIFEEMARRYPNILQVATAARHDEGSVVGTGCDDQFEFEFALDLLLDGFEQLHQRGWTSTQASKHRQPTLPHAPSDQRPSRHDPNLKESTTAPAPAPPR